MAQEKRAVDLGFTSVRYPPGTHMCYLYDDDDERWALMERYLQAGLVDGELVRHFADESVPADVLSRLRGPACGHLDVAVAEDVYCPEHRFSPERMLDGLRATHAASQEQARPGARISGEMTWALRGHPGSERLVEYESRINTLMDAHPLTVMCQYDVRRFSGATIFGILSVHPMMLVKGQVVHNPYYVPPEVYLRRAPQPAAG